jgi:predicted hydrocarbon binding protein
LGVTGIIFNLLEEAVTRRFGAGAWAEMLAKVDVGGYLPFDRYPDDEFFRLLGALPVAPEMEAEERLRWFGRAAVPLLAERYPLIFAPHRSAESFLLTLNAILHPGGKVPADVEAGPLDLEVLEVEPPGGLVLGYRSARRLCALAEGFVTGTAEYYGEEVLIQQPRCMHHGEGRCALVCTFRPAA